MDQEGKFEFIKELGRGSFGSVVLARNTKNGVHVAIKKLERAHLQRYIESEILDHSQLRHPHVVQFREVFLSPHHINIVMDYASGGSLFTYVQSRNRLREPLARWFFQQLILAVDYCHRKGMANNRDIKLENILLQIIPGLPRPLVKICDFGYSKHDNRSVACSKVGKLTYRAPEVLHSCSKSYYGSSADVWSCGVVLYTMLVGRYPFQSDTGAGVGLGHEVVEMLKKMNNQEYFLPDSLNLTPECKNLLRQILNPDDTKRITVLGIMSDPWFRTDLPPEALSMNDMYLAASRPCVQTEDEVRSIVMAATSASTGLEGWPPVFGMEDTGMNLGMKYQPSAVQSAQHQLQPQHEQQRQPAVAEAQHQQHQQPAVTDPQHQQQPMEETSETRLPPPPAAATATTTTTPAASAALPLPPVSTIETKEQLDLNLPSVEAALARCSSTGRQVLLLQLLPQVLQQHSHQLTAQLQAAIKLRHPHVVQLANVYIANDRFNLVLEPCKSTLVQHVQQCGGRLSERVARCFFQQLVLGVACCHDAGVAGIPVEHTLLQVVPNLPQPVVKVLPIPLVAGSSTTYSSAGTATPAPAPASSTSLSISPAATSTSRHQATQQISWEQRVLHDVVGCGRLLNVMLGAGVSATAAAEAPQQQQQDEQMSSVSLLCQQFLQQLLQPEGRSLHTTLDIISHPWFTEDLPAAAIQIQIQIQISGSSPSDKTKMQQQDQDIAAAFEAATAASSRPSLVQLPRLQYGLQSLQQLQLACGNMAQQLPALTLLHSAVQHTLYHAALAVASVDQALGALRFVDMGMTHSSIGAHDSSRAGGATTADTGLLMDSTAAAAAAAAAVRAVPQLMQVQQLLSALDASTTTANTRLSDLKQILTLSSQQQQQQRRIQVQSPSLQMLQLLQSGLQLLSAAQSATAALRHCRAVASSLVTACTHKALPMLPSLGCPVLIRQYNGEAAELVQLLRPVGLMQLAIFLSAVSGAAVIVEPVVGLFALLLLLPACLAAAVNSSDHVITVYDNLQQLPAELLVGQQVLSNSVDSNISVSLAAKQQDRLLWMVGLPVQATRAAYNAVGGSCCDVNQQRQGLTAAADHPALLRAQQQQLPCSLQQYQPFLQLLQQLPNAFLQHAAMAAHASSGLGAVAFSQVVAVCSDPPLLLLEQPSAATLEHWLRRQQQLIGLAAGGSSSSTWAQTAPWPAILQLLWEIAEALCMMHQLPQPAVHGYLHAGAVFLLQPLPDCGIGVEEHCQIRQEQQPQQQQQRHEEAQGQQPQLKRLQVCQDAVQGQRRAQLSLVGPWRQAVSNARLHRPCLTAGEVLLTGAPLSTAADVYGFGMMMLQLAACWVPSEQTPGSDAQVAELRWCHKMLQRTGSTFPCAEVAAAIAAEVVASSWDLTHHVVAGMLPQLPQAELLPAGYMQLMSDCCGSDAAARPTAKELLQRLSTLREHV